MLQVLGKEARPWIIVAVGDDWLSTVGINIPWGALLVDAQGKINDDFQVTFFFSQNFPVHLLHSFPTFTSLLSSSQTRDSQALS
jgi:hypothetical protein